MKTELKSYSWWLLNKRTYFCEGQHVVFGKVLNNSKWGSNDKIQILSLQHPCNLNNKKISMQVWSQVSDEANPNPYLGFIIKILLTFILLYHIIYLIYKIVCFCNLYEPADLTLDRIKDFYLPYRLHCLFLHKTIFLWVASAKIRSLAIFDIKNCLSMISKSENFLEI